MRKTFQFISRYVPTLDLGNLDFAPTNPFLVKTLSGARTC